MAADQTALALPPLVTAGSITAFRYCDYDVPFWARNNSRPGRWHRVGDPPTQYWSVTPDAAWAELIRAESLWTDEELDTVRMPLWACRTPAVGVVDLMDEATREAQAAALPDLLAEDWSATQEFGRHLRSRDFPGVIAPCAALEGHANLTLFGARRMIDWRVRPALVRTVPAAIVAIGRPPEGLVNQVRRPADGPAVVPLFD